MFTHLSSQISDLLPPNLPWKNSFESQLRTLLESVLSNMNLVTREEFEIQKKVLLRTREKLDALEQQVQELEQQLKKDA